ncbi:DUF2867 domain-containing protein [Undibacterium sp. Ren11W]|uniref:DUF2867 domain-containing protein n=1 Tax=Undibacterium sp. Ren11W TaxID=3413045 RepID=UPI003BF0962C
MKRTISASAVPSESVIAGALAGADFYDCYQMPLRNDQLSALELYLRIVAITPAWVNTLMALRNRVVALVGLKNLGHLGAVSHTKPASAYRVGDRVGIFCLLHLSDDEIILGDSDKHLDVKLSLCKQTLGQHKYAALSTVVHIHNTLGRVYMFFVGPAHKIIAPATLARGL